MKELKDMTLYEKASWAARLILVAIGEGRFREELVIIIGDLQQEAYQRGKADAEKKDA